MEASFGFKVTGTNADKVGLEPAAGISLSGRSTGFSSAYATPQSKLAMSTV